MHDYVVCPIVARKSAYYLGVVEVACSNHVAPTSNIKAFSLLR